MYAKSFVSAVAALSLASGVAAVGCDDPTATVISPADATAVGRCQNFDGSVLISKDFSGDLNFGGLQKVGGDITAQDNPNITSITASFLGQIGGSLTLKNLIAMSSLQLQKLASVDKIDWATLRRLTAPTLGTPGITKASSIIISDTTIKNLNGINVDNIKFLNLNNNKDIVTFRSSLKTVSDQIIVDANGLKMEMDLPNLIWASNMTISNVTTFTAPSLQTVNGSLFFNSNYFTTVSFPNLTALSEGTFSFVSNPQLKNLTMPVLKTVGGGFIIANNTQLGEVNGFPKVETIGGAIALRGSFKSFSFSALDDVRGAAEIRSTEDIASACDSFTKDKGGRIQGQTVCTGKDSGANDNTGTANGSGGSTGSSSGAFVVANKGTVFGLGLVAVFYTAFL